MWRTANKASGGGTANGIGPLRRHTLPCKQRNLSMLYRFIDVNS